MRFFSCVICILLVAVLTAGCGTPPEDSEEYSAMMSEATLSEATEEIVDYTVGKKHDMGELALRDSDLGVKIDGKWFGVLGSMDDVLNAVDAQEKSEEGEDESVHTFSNGFSVYGTEVGNSENWYFAVIRDGCNYETGRGIRLGMTKGDVEAAYGKAYWIDRTDEGETLTYCLSATEKDYDSPCIIFDMKDDRVREIQVCYSAAE